MTQATVERAPHPPKRGRFDLKGQVPLTLVLALVLQTGGALFWAGAAAERITQVERETRLNSGAVERVVRLEAQVAALHEQLLRIENKLDRIVK